MEEVARFFSGSVPMSGSHSNAFPAMAPQLFIMGQKTHSEETVSRNGIQRNIHVVVKNSPFHIQLGMANSTLDFNKIAFEASLIYDEGGKEVDYVKSKPVDFKSVPNDNGTQLDCELRIKVLTSHHEDLLFKIKIQGHNPITKEDYAGLCLNTFPIKVISKPEQLKKRAPSKKRTLTDMLVETVTRIEKKQEEQQRYLEKMMTQQASVSINMPIPAVQTSKKQKIEELTFWDAITSDAQQKEKLASKESVPDFEEAFATLIKTYTGMKSEEKPETIRKLIRNSSTRDTERLSELLDLFWTEGLLKERSFGSRPTPSSTSSGSTQEGCCCNECPHKLELERIDEFYKEFLSSGVSLPGF